MMGLGWLLIPALAGYILQTNLHQYRYRTLRDPGQHVVFRSVVTGSILVFFARPIVTFFTYDDLTLVGFLNRSFFIFVTNENIKLADDAIESFQFEYIATIGLSVILALVFWIVNNALRDRDRAAISAAKEHGDLKGAFATEAIETCETVEVSLNTGKVYIGQIVQSGIGVSSEFDLMISPLYSGYRDRETNELYITQFYYRILRIIQEDKDRRSWPDLRIGISLSDVISIRSFDPELYLKSSPPANTESQ